MTLPHAGRPVPPAGGSGTVELEPLASGDDTGRQRSPGALRRSVSWRGALVLSIGSALQITLALGYMAQDLGSVQILVWFGAALFGVVQCMLLAELATYFPGRSGTATYAHEAVGTGAPWVAALAGWGYWFAWTPGIAINLVLAAEYLRAGVAPGMNTAVFVAVVGLALYWCNARGLRTAVNVSVALAVLAGAPLVALLLSPIWDSSLFNVQHVVPFDIPQSGSHGPAATVLMWLFVATWSAYGAEIASTAFAEMHEPRSRAFRTMGCAGGITLLAFTLVPLMMTGLVGSDNLAQDPATAFLRPAEVVFGSSGSKVVAVMLCGALVLGAQGYIVASSRTLYQMSQDGYLPRFLGKLSRRGVPTRSGLFDAAVITVMVMVFGTDLVGIVAAANVGYLVVFVIVPLSFVAVRLHRGHHGLAIVLPGTWTAAALGAALLNAGLLVVGAALWGPAVWLTGGGIIAAVLPLFALRRLLDRRRRRASLV